MGGNNPTKRHDLAFFSKLLDVDGDGACVPSIDLTAADHAIWNGSFDYVEYELVLEPPLADPDFVCGSF